MIFRVITYKSVLIKTRFEVINGQKYIKLVPDENILRSRAG